MNTAVFFEKEELIPSVFHCEAVPREAANGKLSVLLKRLECRLEAFNSFVEVFDAH